MPISYCVSPTFVFRNYYIHFDSVIKSYRRLVAYVGGILSNTEVFFPTFFLQFEHQIYNVGSRIHDTLFTQGGYTGTIRVMEIRGTENDRRKGCKKYTCMSIESDNGAKLQMSVVEQWVDFKCWAVASFQQNLGDRPDRRPFLSTLEPSPTPGDTDTELSAVWR